MTKAILIPALIAAFCAGLLSIADAITRPQIETNWHAERTRLAAEIISITPEIDIDESVSGSCAAGLLLRLATEGYAGPIDWLAAYQPIQNRLSLRAARHRETPGIGDIIDGEWLHSKDTQASDEWRLIDSVSGATITVRAVQRAADLAIATGGETCE